MWSLLVVLSLLWIGPAWAGIVCDGIDDIVTAGANSTLITQSDGTIMMLLKHAGTPDTGGTCGRDILVGNAATDLHGLRVLSGGFWGALNWDGSNDCATGTFSTAWTHLTWRHTGGNVELYLDGALANFTASGNTTNITQNNVLCWNGTTANAAAPITIEEVLHFNVGVPVDEIQAIGASRISGLHKTAPTAWWTFDCVSGGSADAVVFADRTGNSRTTTADNGANNTGMSCLGSQALRRRATIQ